MLRMGEQIKVAYTTLTGVESRAYVDDETLIGTDKYTDEPVELGIRYFEVAPAPQDASFGGENDG
jgi:hypothetical protein